MSQFTSRAALRGTTSTRGRRLSRLLAGLVAMLAMLMPVSTAAAAPSPPTGLHLQGVSTNQVALAWNPVPDAKLYEFYANGSRVGSATRNTPATFASYMLTPGSSHNWTVRVTTADGQVSAQSAPITVVQKSSATSVSGCPSGTISSGAWTLSADITLASLSTPCFTLGSDASLDCLGHTISITTTNQTASVISIPSGQRDVVTNCKIKLVASGTDDINGIHVGGAAWSPSTAQYVTLHGNTITGPPTGTYAINAAGASNLVISSNTITDGLVGDFLSPNLVISGNSITEHSTWTNVAAGVWIHGAQGVIIGNNTINGGAPGNVGNTGGGNDDNIILDNGIDGAYVRDNTLGHVYDAAIEPTDWLTNSHLDGNTISYAYETGIGQYYGVWMTGTTISDNVISNAGHAVEIIPEEPGGGSGLPSGHSSYSFTGNTLNNNTFTPSAGNLGSLCLTLTSVVYPVASSGNVITNNKWGSGPIPLINPLSAVSTLSGNTPSTVRSTGTC